ncbi:MAG: hypothetical protein ACOH5I_23145 [Oligoflexus sp.]
MLNQRNIAKVLISIIAMFSFACQQMDFGSSKQSSDTPADEPAENEDESLITANEPVMTGGAFLVDCGPAKLELANEQPIGCRSLEPTVDLRNEPIEAWLVYSTGELSRLTPIPFENWNEDDKGIWQILFPCDQQCQEGQLHLEIASDGKSLKIFDRSVAEILYGTVIREDCGSRPRCLNSLAAWQQEWGLIDFGTCPVGDLVCLGIKAMARIEGSWSRADNQGFIIDGWNTSAEHHVHIVVSGQAFHHGQISNQHYHLVPVQEGHAIDIRTPYTIVDGVRISEVKGDSSEGIRVSATEVELRNLLIHDLPDIHADGIYINQSNLRVRIINSIFYRISRSAVMLQGFPNPIDNTEVLIANSLAYDNCLPQTCDLENFRQRFGSITIDTAFQYTNTSLVVYNSISFSRIRPAYHGLHFSPSSQANIASDNSAPGVQPYQASLLDRTQIDAGAEIPAAVFEDLEPSKLNFRPFNIEGNLLLGTGVDLSSLFQSDLLGQTRTGPWTIGPFH